MSGTSLDGVDGVLVTFLNGKPSLVASHHQAFSASLKQALFALNTSGMNELETAALQANQLAGDYATAAKTL